MPVKTHELSATDFRDPILLSLGQLTEGKAHQSVSSNVVLDLVLQRMQITEEEYGGGANGRSRVRRWFSKAFDKIRRDGLGTSARKGHWGLTVQGIEVLNSLVSSRAATPERKSTKEDDAYLLQVASLQASCLGFYSMKSKSCAECLLPTQCVSYREVLLQEMAQSMRDDETHERNAQEVAYLLGLQEEPPPPGTVVSVLAERLADQGFNIMQTPVETICAGCGQDILAGEDVAWEPSEGTFHPTCALP